jgi:hypothetical protein
VQRQQHCTPLLRICDMIRADVCTARDKLQQKLSQVYDGELSVLLDLLLLLLLLLL